MATHARQSARQDTERTLPRVMSFLGPWKWAYWPTMVLHALTMAVGFNIILAFLIRDVVNAATKLSPVLLTHAATLACVTCLVGLPIFCVTHYALLRYTRKTVSTIAVRLFDHLLSLPMKRFDREHSGDLISRSTNDVQAIENLYSNQAYLLILGILIGAISLTSMFLLNWRLGIVTLGYGLLTLAATTVFVGPLRRVADEAQQQLGTINARFSDLLQSDQVTRMFQLESLVYGQFGEANVALTTSTLKQARLDALSGTVNFLLFEASPFLLLAVGSYMVLQGTLDIGTAMAATYLQGNVGYFFSTVGSVLTGVQANLAGARRVFELLDSPVETASPAPSAVGHLSQAVQPPRGQGLGQRPFQAAYQMSDHLVFAPAPAVEMKNVSFSYDDHGQAVNHVNLEVGHGQTVALVGKSGSGKSTVFKLLLGLYPPSEGDILVQGRSIGCLTLPEVRGLSAYVSQDAYLFDGTIYDNIAYGNPDVTECDVLRAATAAYAHEFISQLPDGYKTQVGERGSKLSGGQRQRVTIARAILKEAPILLLDEATSALDAESELLVGYALDALMKGRTTLVIAHRLETVRRADKIIVLDAGRVVEQGIHDALIRGDGQYARLYQAQSNSAVSHSSANKKVTDA